MKFKRIFVEKEVLNFPQTQKILQKLKNPAIEIISKYTDYFEKVQKPYLHKRDSLYLYIAKKRGELVKLAPDRYGTPQEKHYYYYNSLNCIYECEYCYLQGYFFSPDIVLFMNYEDILHAIEEIARNEKGKVWFHGGEFSDSLALSHLTEEFSLFFPFFGQNPQLQWELRTKSANIRPLLKEKPIPNLHVTFSLAPKELSSLYEHKTAPVGLRLRSAKKLALRGFFVGFHLDPIIWHQNFLADYELLIKNLRREIPIEQISYISLGTLRFPKEVFLALRKNYPKSPLLYQNFLKGSDGKMRYHPFLAKKILQEVRDLFLKEGFPQEKIYFCMETE